MTKRYAVWLLAGLAVAVAAGAVVELTRRRCVEAERGGDEHAAVDERAPASV